MVLLLLFAAIIPNIILAASILLKSGSTGHVPVLHTVSSVITSEASVSAVVLALVGAPSAALAAVSSLALVFAVVPPAAGVVQRLRSAPGSRQARPEPPPPVRKQEPDTMESYTALFERCCLHMETKKPFLVESLTLADLANAMYTNTFYLSRTINACSGKNFRRFVNDYRVDYAMKIFRNNTSLKVTQLSMMSGFHTVITFNMAFKLVKGVSPSVWCQSVRFGAEKTAKSAPKPTSP